MRSFFQRMRRANALEQSLQNVEQRASTLETLVRIIEERSRTLEYLANQSVFAHNYQIEFLQRFYVETVQQSAGFKEKQAFNLNKVLQLKTDHPIAVESNDHVNPDSTTEGVTRPTLFVRDCIKVLGKDIRILDLGTGAAGNVFEFAMNGITAIGVDGSDFCRKNRIGYWPLLPNNLFTCDISKPFNFVAVNGQTQVKFDVITMWEVLEHLDLKSLQGLFQNIEEHLDEGSYFIGSVSLVGYDDVHGNPYHVTLQPREWWQARFKEHGLEMLVQHPFAEKFFPRGNGPRYQDFHNYHQMPEDGFHFVARKALPLVPLAASDITNAA